MKSKMRTLISLCLGFCFLILVSCQQKETVYKQDSLEKEKATITGVLMQQKEDWNAFDIDGFMEGYWKSEKLSFIGSRGITRGWQQTLDNYKESYPDQAAMGKLDFEVIELDVIGPEDAIMIGRYTLFREKDTPSGLFTLRWKKIAGEWKIVSDQTCG